VQPLDILDTAALTRERFGRGAFSTQKTGRELLKRVIPVLAANLASEAAPRHLGGLNRFFGASRTSSSPISPCERF
jgi:hypothetical protein